MNEQEQLQKLSVDELLSQPLPLSRLKWDTRHLRKGAYAEIRRRLELLEELQQRREDHGPNGDATTPGFFKPEPQQSEGGPFHDLPLAPGWKSSGKIELGGQEIELGSALETEPPNLEPSPCPEPQQVRIELCSDCPPSGYPTDRTRCTECPRAYMKRGEQSRDTERLREQLHIAEAIIDNLKAAERPQPERTHVEELRHQEYIGSEEEL